MQHGFGSFAASARSGGDLPSILQALQSGHIGTARPSYVEDGMVWHKHRPSEGLAGTIEKYFTFGGVDHLEGAFDLSSGKYSGAGGGGATPVFDAVVGSGIFKAPTSGRVLLCLFGPGGSGGRVQDSTGRAAGGGAGGSVFKMVQVERGEIIEWVAGAGYPSRVNSGDGVSGGTSLCSATLASGSFSLSATSGEGGSRGTGSGTSIGGVGGSGSGGDINLTGGAGGTAISTGSNRATGAGGAALLFPGQAAAADGDAATATNEMGIAPFYNITGSLIARGGLATTLYQNSSSNQSVMASNGGEFGGGGGGVLTHNPSENYYLSVAVGPPGGMVMWYFNDDVFSAVGA
jgi:hypothetical protein